MAVVEQTQVAPFGAESILRIVNVVSAFVEEMRVEFAAQRMADSLKGLSKAQLSDIGLGDADVMTHAREIARRSF